MDTTQHCPLCESYARERDEAREQVEKYEHSVVGQVMRERDEALAELAYRNGRFTKLLDRYHAIIKAPEEMAPAELGRLLEALPVADQADRLRNALENLLYEIERVMHEVEPTLEAAKFQAREALK